MSYCWYNVRADYENNTFIYSHDGGTTYSRITLEDCIYSYREMTEAISKALISDGRSKTGIKYVLIQPH